MQETSVEEAMNAATRVEVTVDLDNFWIFLYIFGYFWILLDIT